MVVWLCIVSVFVLSVIFAAYVFLDSQKRGENRLVWTGGTMILGPLYFPMYLGRRKTLTREAPTGDLDSNVALHFAWVWSVYMLVVIVWTLIYLLTASREDVDKVGVSQGLAISALLCCWVVPAGLAFLFSVVMMEPPDAPTRDEASENQPSDQPDQHEPQPADQEDPTQAG